MSAAALLLFTVVACFVAFRNWRAGLLLCVIVGLLQDPVREVTAGTPAYLTLTFLPICFAMLVGLWNSTDLQAAFRRHYPQLITASGIFGVALLVSTAQTLSYGLHTLPLALLGLFSYGGGIPALLLGFFYLRRDFRELNRPLVVLGGLTAFMLVGVPLESAGYKFDDPWLGTIGMSGGWRRWYSETQWVDMISGFHRSPEIMGWHAAVLVVVCVYLLAWKPRFFPVWAGLAAWGSACVLLSGRRKMLLIVLAFAAVYLLLAGRAYRRRLFFGLVGVAVVVLPTLSYLVGAGYQETAETTLPTAGARVAGHTLTGPFWLLSVVGPFGYGVGTKTQGVQHLGIDIPAPLTEGGLEKIFVELGSVGTFTFLMFILVLAHCVVLSFRRVHHARLDQRGVGGMTAFVVANAAVFTVAFQVYGDPLIVFLVSFAGGLLLSGSRLAMQREQAARAEQTRSRKRPACRLDATSASGPLAARDPSHSATMTTVGCP